MKTSLLGIGLLTLMVTSCVTASSPSTIDYRVTADLRDGSRVVGTSMDKNFDFKSSLLGEMKLSPDKMQVIEPGARTNDVKLTTAAGDTLHVSFDMEQVRVKTSYGEVKLPVSQIKSLRVSKRGGPGRPSDGLVGLWSANGNAMDSVTGRSGNLRNVSFTGGVNGQAFCFAPNSFPWGTYNGVEIPDDPAYALTQEMTIEGWVRPRGDGYIIMCRGDHRPGMDPYTLSMQCNHDLRFQICGDSGDTSYIDANLPYCQWTHVAAVYDGNNNTISLYTNGVLAAQAETHVHPIGRLISEMSPGLGIGNINDGGNNFPFVGDIDEIALYNRALSVDEINAIYSENEANAGEKCGLLPTRQNRFGVPMRNDS